MKILSVSPFLPHPPDHGTRIRTWNLLDGIADEHQITLLTWVRDGDRPESLEACRQRFHRVIAHPSTPDYPSIGMRVAIRVRSAISRVPPYIEFMKAVRPALPVLDEDFDVAVAEDDAAMYFMPDVRCPIIVHRHNIFSDTIAALRASGALGPARKIKWSLELPMWRRFDRYLSTAADLSIVTTPEAGDSLRAVVPDARIEVVPNGVEGFPDEIGVADSHRAVFVGQMDYEPNADAVVRFCNRSWPRIRAAIPDATFAIIGRRPMAIVSKLQGDGVEVLGEVDSIAAACTGAMLGVIPLYAGSGIKNKTVELMSLGLPVVTTPAGSEGISLSDSDGVLVADDDLAVADAVIALMKDHPRAVKMGEAARRFIQANFSWDAAVATYRDVIAKAAEMKGLP